MTVTDTKTSLKSLIRAALNFIALTPSRSIRHMLANFARAEFVKTVSNFRKKKESHCLVFTFSRTKRELRHFHVVVVQ